MPPAMNPAPFIRSCTLRPRVLRPVIGVKRPATSTRRRYATNDPDTLPEAPPGQKGPNTQQQEHISEEAAKTAQVMGKEGPDMEVGTPVQEILQDEKEVRKQAPQVLKDQMKKDGGAAGAQNATPSTSTGGTSEQRRGFATMARRRMEVEQTSSAEVSLPPSMLGSSESSAVEADRPALKFPAPTTPLPHFKMNREDPIVTQLTNLMMRDGKKSVAQRNMSQVLTILRTSPSPTYSPQRTLLPGAPPASHLPLNPVLYLTLAIDSVAPLLRIRSQRGAAGGGVALQIPVPLGLRQRRRQAFTWILDAADKKGNRLTFPERVAQEIIGVVEGRSSVWEKRSAVHRLGTTARSSLNFGRGGRR